MVKSNRKCPPSLRTCIQKEVTKYVPEKSHILVSVSGGPDSMALLHVLSTLRNDYSFMLSAVGVDHGLRPESKAEMDLVEKYCHSIGVSFHRRTISLAFGGNTQARAREARYKAVREVQEVISANLVATGHHADDRAETVLMRIIWGTTVASLSVIRPLSYDLFRPMYGATRQCVMVHIERNSIPHVMDPSNAYTDKYLRSKLRHEIIPSLAKINPNIMGALCDLSDSATFPEISGAKADRRSLYSSMKLC